MRILQTIYLQKLAFKQTGIACKSNIYFNNQMYFNQFESFRSSLHFISTFINLYELNKELFMPSEFVEETFKRILQFY